MFVRQDRASTRRKYAPGEKIRIVLEGFRRELTVSDLCRREGIKLGGYCAVPAPRTSWRDRRRTSASVNVNPKGTHCDGVKDTRPCQGMEASFSLRLSLKR